jgi:membrane protein DedA with SNARE-associated domain
VHQGWLSLPVAIAAATAGNLAGSSIAYWLGRRGLLARLPSGSAGAVARCERVFARRGDSTVFIARLLPLARTFVSLPAGHVGVPFWRFVLLTIAGCALWSGASCSPATSPEPVGSSSQQPPGACRCYSQR